MEQYNWKEQLLSIIEEMEEGYAEVDLEGNLTNVNSAFCNIWGFSREELIGQTHRLFTSSDQARENAEVFQKVLNTGIPNKSYTFEGIRKDREKRLVNISIYLLEDPNGNPAGLRGLYRDITEHRKVQEQLAAQKNRLGTILQNLKEGIITVGPDMHLLEINEAARDVCSLASDVKNGRLFSDPHPQCVETCLKMLQETLKSKRAINAFSIQCNRKQHATKFLAMTSTPLINADEQYLGAILIIRDHTRLKDLERRLSERHQYQEIIGNSIQMREIFSLLDDLKDIDSTVLVSGENGTGKELIARALHFNGKRELKPFVTVNCSALAENLLESELFGHVKGAFTGAVVDSEGRFKTADGGTLLLDEIGDISLRMQIKLLRVLQEKEFEPVGSSKPVKVNVRLIACTNRNLKELVNSGDFREDLYYRLKVIEIFVPPLRKRQEDIPLLFKHFLKKFRESLKKDIRYADDAVMKVLIKYPWPGNIRELEHVVERAVILCHRRAIGLDHLPQEIIQGAEKTDNTLHLPSAGDSTVLHDALRKTGWNKAKAARLMGVSRPTVYRLMKKYGLADPTGKV